MRVLSLFFVVFVLIGCSGTTIGGNEDKSTPVYLEQHLIVGKTAKTEVRQYFGAPDSGHTTVTASDKESWYYLVDKGINLVSLASSTISVTGTSQAADAVGKSNQKDSDSLTISFDEKGAVENWTC